jgi:Transposase, Mutator family
MYAEIRAQAREAITRFAGEYGSKYPKSVATLEKDADVLLTFFDFPAEHWKHLRTSNVIESPFATVRLRQRVTKGAGSRTKALLMAYKLLDPGRRSPVFTPRLEPTRAPLSGSSAVAGGGSTPGREDFTSSSQRSRSSGGSCSSIKER